jgi:hypothetical protein
MRAAREGVGSEDFMKCLHCGEMIPDAFFEAWKKSAAAKSGRFNCPHCTADHARREIGRLPSGEMQYSVRLWGHLTEIRRKKKEGEGSPPAS